MTSKFKTLFSGSKRSTRVILILAAVLLVASSGGYYYYAKVYLPSQTTTTTKAMQTATVRQGDLVIYASGTGTLVASDEVNLAFKSSGQVTAINVAVGDKVNAGDVLATIDDTTAQIEYTQAVRSLNELTSLSAIASAQSAVATAMTDLADAQSHLQYVISPQVYNAELALAEKEQAVKDAQAAVDANSSSTEAKAKLQTAQDELKAAQEKLKKTQYYYDTVYIPETFTSTECTGQGPTRSCKDHTYQPTEATVLEARAAVTAAQASLNDAQNLYNMLTGAEISEGATGSGLTEIENAKLAVATAKENLKGTSIVAPITGTVMSIDTTVGDTLNSGTTVITVADLDQPYLEIYLDESDWANIQVGYETEVTFDILPDKTFTGKVTEVDPGLYASGNTNVVKALVEINNISDSLKLPLGTSASVDVIGGRADNAVLVPIEALHDTGDGQYAVFVVENGKPRLKVVEVGIQDLLYAEIKSGLNPGDVVTTGITETK
ncbi:MAG: efflux RND transporter periplasmic adaptor subunit [Anaerolineales bacterium]